MELFQAFFLPCLWAFLSCIGFCFMFHIQGIGMCICGFGGALGWFVYLLVLKLQSNDIFAGFVAAVAIAIFSEWMARLRRCPVTGYVQVALLPLVPGAGIYYAMRHSVAGETDQFLSTLLHTFGMAAALAVGAMLASTVWRTLLPRIPVRKKEKR